MTSDGRPTITLSQESADEGRGAPSAMRLRDNPFGMPAIALGAIAVFLWLTDNAPPTVPPMVFLMTVTAMMAVGAAFGYGVAMLERRQ
jgi:hypothetical protein